jgi:hypothetical protein
VKPGAVVRVGTKLATVELLLWGARALVVFPDGQEVIFPLRALVLA